MADKPNAKQAEQERDAETRVETRTAQKPADLVEVTVAKGHTVQTATTRQVASDGKTIDLPIAQRFAAGAVLRVHPDEAKDLLARGVIVDPDAPPQQPAPAPRAVTIVSGRESEGGATVTTAG
jgi:5-formyltetrahydrofolate cyclo-ligase